jgi:hypothetical protein
VKIYETTPGLSRRGEKFGFAKRQGAKSITPIDFGRRRKRAFAVEERRLVEEFRKASLPKRTRMLSTAGKDEDPLGPERMPSPSSRPVAVKRTGEK